MTASEMKYKICVVSSLYPPYTRGGAEKMAELAVNGLQKAGHKAFVITTEPWKNFYSFFPRLLKSENAKIYRFFPLNIFSFAAINAYPFFLRLIWRFFDVFNLHSAIVVWRILRKEMPDFVWTHNLTGIGFLIPFVIKLNKIPHVHTLHDVSLIEPSGIIIKGKEKRGFLTRLFFSKITKKLFGFPDLVISPSKWLADFYLNHEFFKNSKIKIIKNPIEFTEDHLPRIFGEMNLLYIGQLEKHKGILFLINVLSELAAQYKFKLFVVGTGKLFNKLKSLSQKTPWMVLCGRLDSGDLKNIMDKTSVCIVPSLTYENSPTVIYESLSKGIPVVASAIGGIPELVKDGRNGFLFEPGNKTALKEALSKIFKNPELLKNLSQNALTFEAKNSILYINELMEIICHL